MITKARTILLLIITGSVTATAGLWFYHANNPAPLVEIALFSSIGLIILISLFLGFKRLANERKGLASEDELSVRIQEKAGLKAFVFSVLLWTFGGYQALYIGIEGRLVLGGGILGMALLFFGFWLYYSRVGTGKRYE